MANNKIIVKRTTTSGRQPNTTASYATNSQYIAAGELALNMADGILYSSNGSTVIEIGANNTNAQVTGTLTINAVSANGSVGATNQVLTSNGSTVYWSTSSGSGTVTSVDSGNGLTGGPITSTGSLSVLANSGIVANSTGTFVNANTGIVANSTGVFLDQTGQYTFTNTQTFSNTITFGNSTVNAVANSTSIKLSNSTVNTIFTIPTAANYSATNVFLHANGSWVAVSAGAGSVNTDAQYTWTNTHTFSNVITFNANLVVGSTGELIIDNAAGIYANGSLGTDGQVLTSNGTTVYWATSSGGTFDYGLTYAIKAISF